MNIFSLKKKAENNYEYILFEKKGKYEYIWVDKKWRIRIGIFGLVITNTNTNIHHTLVIAHNRKMLMKRRILVRRGIAAKHLDI